MTRSLDDRRDGARPEEAKATREAWKLIDTGDVKPIAALLADRDRLAAENERLREALTPSAATQAAYMGEFWFLFPVTVSEGVEHKFTPNVPWTTIKEIMAAIRARAALNGGADV